VATVLVLSALGAVTERGPRPAPTRLVAEDASAPLRRIAIHYAPAADDEALGVWKQLFAVLPARVQVDVEVAEAAHFDRFLGLLRAAGVGAPERFHPVVVGVAITTWSRDRYAALADDDGKGSILAPPFLGAEFAARTGDWRSPFAMSQALYRREPQIAKYAFEGGDLAATPRYLFADINLVERNRGRGRADRALLESRLAHDFGQELVWLGDASGDVPMHHIMMYLVPLDDHTVAVGDERAALALLDAAHVDRDSIDLDPDVETHIRRLDHAAELVAARGFHVVRFPALVLEGGRTYVTYTNAVFDRAPRQENASSIQDVKPDGTTDARPDQRIVYLPTYDLPALDDEAARLYASLGYAVHRIDVSPIYHRNGSLGCLVNVISR
jgi:hypothetical protein